jgi:hypothetical protein
MRVFMVCALLAATTACALPPKTVVNFECREYEGATMKGRECVVGHHCTKNSQRFVETVIVCTMDSDLKNFYSPVG